MRRPPVCSVCGAPTNGGSLCDRCGSRVGGRGTGFLGKAGTTFPQLIWQFQVFSYWLWKVRERAQTAAAREWPCPNCGATGSSPHRPGCPYG